MKLYMYEAKPNYGDVLNRHIWPRYFADFLSRNDDVMMFGIGTLLGQDVRHPGRIIVCGSGCGYEPDVSQVAGYNIFWVRGPHSARLLGLADEQAITDPAILVDECFPSVAPSGRVSFMPHWETAQNPLWRLACERADIDYIDPLDEVEKVSAQLSGARLVLAEAMHGAIVADVYRVPWVPIATSAQVNLFKWHDWAASLAVEPKFVTLPQLGLSDWFRNVLAEVRTAEGLRRASQSADVIPQTAAENSGAGLIHGLNWLYNIALPRQLRYRVEHRLAQKIGPAYDARLAAVLADGRPHRRLDVVAAQLKNLAQQTGYLSAPDVAARQRARVLARIADVREYLARA